MRRLDLLTRPTEPLTAGTLALLAILTLLAVRYARDLLPGDKDARSHVLQIAGGLVVLLGAYFTAIGMTFNRAQQRAELLGQTIGRLGSQDMAAKIGAVWMLQAIALDAPRNRGAAPTTRAVHQAIWDALEYVDPNDDGKLTHALAEVKEAIVTIDPHFERHRCGRDGEASHGPPAQTGSERGAPPAG